MKVAHLTTVDLSLLFLIRPQLLSIVEMGGEGVGISAPGPFVEELEAAGIRHVALTSSTRGMAPWQDLKAAVQLWRILRRERPDILHTHNPKPGLYGRVLGRLAGVPIVINTVHGLYAAPDDSLPKRLLVYVLETIAARFSDAELVQSSEDLALLSRWRISPRGRARFLGNGVDLARFDPRRTDATDRRRIRAQLGISDGQVVVGMVGRLVEEKGYPELFSAARILKSDYVVLVIGPDDDVKGDALDPALIRQAQADGVRFLGMRTDLEHLYRAMDLFVLPSHREGFPRAAMEAAAMGLPVVATDIRGCREVVEHGVNGLLIPVQDPDALANAIRKLGEDGELRAELGAAGYQKARHSFDEDRVVATVIDTYRQVAVRKGLTNLAEALGSDRGSPSLRLANPTDAIAIARLHLENIVSGFLSRLGRRFLVTLYRALISWPGAVVVVVDAGAGPIGFVAGVMDTAAFYKGFLLQHGAAAFVSGFPALLHPANIRRAWETLTYRGAGIAANAELLSMAVDPNWRGRGLGNQLGKKLLEALASVGATPVRVVVGAANAAAVSAYERMGFVHAGSTEVHAGEISRVLVWPA